MEKSGENSENLEQFFQTKKLYVRMGLIILGCIIVFFLIRKMKADYVN